MFDGHEGLIPDWIEFAFGVGIFVMFIIAVWTTPQEK